MSDTIEGPAAIASAPPLGGLLDRLAARVLPKDPIVLKELRIALRTPLFVRFLYLSTALGGLVTLVAGAQTALETSPADAGRLVFHAYFCIALLATSLAAPVFGATSIALERETLTLDSLLLTRLSAARIVRGKFVAIALSLALLLVASSPIAAVAFLFGGVGPLEIALSFVAVLLASLPAIAIGMALSSRTASTRVTLLGTLLVWLPVSTLGLLGLWAIGSDLRRLGTDDGPFWFARYLPAHLDDPRVVAALLVAPLFVIGMITWFGLAISTSGLLPATHDRARPFRRWLLAASIVTPVVALLCIWPFTRTPFGDGVENLAEGMLAVTVLPAILGLVGAFALVAEPLVRPRVVQAADRRRHGIVRAFSATFGAGAAPATRFLFVAFGLSAISVTAVYAIVHAIAAGGVELDALLPPLVPLAVCTVSAAFAASLGMAVRATTQSPWLGRGALVAVTVGLVLVLPVFWALATGDDPDDWMRDPMSLGLAWPGISIVAAADAIDGTRRSLAPLVVPFVSYIGLTAILALVTERRAAKATEADRRQRARVLASAEHTSP
ncbi:MAG: hypothetical protein IT379_18530 [Deltaproteobacteria bacterium]|nr:hypothetical protein [Deltaproteobacteria bacterium]